MISIRESFELKNALLILISETIEFARTNKYDDSSWWIEQAVKSRAVEEIQDSYDLYDQMKRDGHLREQQQGEGSN